MSAELAQAVHRLASVIERLLVSMQETPKPGRGRPRKESAAGVLGQIRRAAEHVPVPGLLSSTPEESTGPVNPEAEARLDAALAAHDATREDLNGATYLPSDVGAALIDSQRAPLTQGDSPFNPDVTLEETMSLVAVFTNRKGTDAGDQKERLKGRLAALGADRVRDLDQAGLNQFAMWIQEDMQ